MMKRRSTKQVQRQWRRQGLSTDRSWRWSWKASPTLEGGGYPNFWLPVEFDPLVCWQPLIRLTLRPTDCLPSEARLATVDGHGDLA